MRTNDDARTKTAKRGDWRLLVAGLALMATATVLFASTVGRAASGGGTRSGRWSIDARRAEANLTLEYGDGGSHSTSSDRVVRDQIRGLDTTAARGGGDVHFQVVRDAGTFDCEGWWKGDQGAGTFEFSANPAYAQRCQSLGYGTPTADQQFRLAVADVGYDLFDQLHADGYKDVTVDDLVRLGEHGVDTRYLRGMREAGYTFTSTATVVRIRDHGVDPEVVGELRALGYTNLSAEQLVRTVDHGVRADYIRDLAALGYHDIGLDDLIRMRDHGVDPEFVSSLATEGYKGLEFEELIRMRDHGVDAAFARAANGGAGHALTPDELVYKRDHGEQ